MTKKMVPAFDILLFGEGWGSVVFGNSAILLQQLAADRGGGRAENPDAANLTVIVTVSPCTIGTLTPEV